MTAILLPLLIAIVFIGISVVAAMGVNRKVNKTGRFSYSKRVYWIFSSYVVILLAGMVFASVHPSIIIDGWKKASGEDFDREGLELYDAAVEGKIDQVDSKFLRKKWDFNLQDKKLNLVVQNDEYLNTSIIVERKNTNDGKLDAVFYQTGSSVNGMDISELANPPGLKLAGDQLIIMKPKEGKFEYSEFANVFSISQFTGEASLFEHHSDFTGGQSILYLRIPKDLELHDQSNQDIQFVE
ncbi:hypothetical protein ACFVSW_07695 [Neobacillus sp. NPDC058068]|uniref:hypothetical protein n=1 Tax=Neobacillus sp. NPDC058068 TaxID=3346325 RepID=UPI0036D7CF1F